MGLRRTRTRMRIPRIAPSQNSRPPADLQQTFFEHLAELRSRLFVVAIALVSGGVIGYIFQDAIAAFLLAPLHGEKLVYLTPGGGLDFIFKISLYAGMLVALPVAVYEIYKYLSPLIPSSRTRHFAALVIVASGTLAVAGILFGYYIIMPSALEFLANFAGKYVHADLTATSYIDFVALHSLGVAAIFQAPIILLFVNSINGPIKPIKLLKSEQYVVLGSIVIAALIAPPDLKNQTLVALPIFLIYQLGVVAVVIQNGVRSHPTGHQYVAIPFPPRRPVVSPNLVAPPVKPLVRRAPQVGFDMVVTRPKQPMPQPQTARRITVRPQPRRLSVDGMVIPRLPDT